MVDALTIVLLAAVLLAGLVALAVGSAALARRARDRVHGALVAADDGREHAVTLRSVRWGISGRPDELRQRADGTLVPIELKSRSTPRSGVPFSHQVQLWAYCLLVEEESGRSPPYGVLRYGDGREFAVPWGRAEREALLRLRAEMALPYDGRANPSPGRCARCRFWAVCDARAA